MGLINSTCVVSVKRKIPHAADAVWGNVNIAGLL